jgi:hypothetical protein
MIGVATLAACTAFRSLLRRWEEVSHGRIVGPVPSIQCSTLVAMSCGENVETHSSTSTFNSQSLFFLLSTTCMDQQTFHRNTPFSELLLAVFNVGLLDPRSVELIDIITFQSILEVFILCLSGYLLARRGVFDKKTQKVCSILRNLIL